MDFPKFIVSNQKEESISIQIVNGWRRKYSDFTLKMDIFLVFVVHYMNRLTFLILVQINYPFTGPNFHISITTLLFAC